MENNHDVSHSFTDLMTSLAVIFILLLVATLNHQFKGSKDDVESVRKALKMRLAVKGLELLQDPNDPFVQIIKIDENKLKFGEGKAELGVQGAEWVKFVSSVLSGSLCNNELEDKVESIIFEGHTSSSDDDTFGGKLRNVKLSQDRAYAVLHEAFKSIDDGKDAVECLRMMSSATGRGSSRPLSSEAEKQQENRRVEIKIRVKSPKIIAKSPEVPTK